MLLVPFCSLGLIYQGTEYKQGFDKSNLMNRYPVFLNFFFEKSQDKNLFEKYLLTENIIILECYICVHVIQLWDVPRS